MPVVIAIFALVAAIFVWQWRQPDCPGGKVVTSESECAAHFGAAKCEKAFAEGRALARRSGPTFPTQAACLDRYPVCIERSDALLWAPRPSAYCVAPAADGAGGRVEPRYSIR